MPSERTPCDLLVAGGTCVTVDARRRIVRDGAIAIVGGTIAAVGPAAELTTRYAARRTIDATGKVVAPGLVNAHLHMSQHLFRGFVPDDVEADEYIFDWAVPYYVALEPEEERLAVTLACCDLLRRGITSVGEAGTMRFPLACAEAIEQVGLRAALGRWVWDLVETPEALRMTTGEALTAVEQLLEAIGADPRRRVRAMASVIGMGCCSDALLRGAKELADEHGAMFNLHQSVSEEEATAWRAHEGFETAPVAHLDQLGALGANVRLIHLLELDAGEIALLGERDVKVVRCLGASSTRHLPALRDAGVSVALGTDTVNVSNTVDVLRAAHVAAAYCREDPRRNGQLRAETALEMCTIDGAVSLAQEALVGSLEAGKQADLVVFDADRPEWVPNFDPVANLVYSADGGSVDTVLVGGEPLVERGRLTRIDEAALYAEARAVAERVVARAGLRERRRERWPVVGTAGDRTASLA